MSNHKLNQICTAIFLLMVMSLFSQTKNEKELIYKLINSNKINNHTIFDGKIKKDSINKLFFMNNAEFYMYYKLELDSQKRANFIKEKNVFFITFEKKTYKICNDSIKVIYDNIPFFNELEKNSLSGVKCKIVYLLDKINNADFYGDIVFSLFTNDNLSVIYDKKKYYPSIDSYIIEKYGSYENYLDRVRIDSLRQNVNIKEKESNWKTNYRLFEDYCPKNEVLVINTFIAQINKGSNGITKQQENKLRELILKKLHPFKSIYDTMQIENIKDGMVQIENEEEEYINQNEKIGQFQYGLVDYGFRLYNIDITSDLMYVLTRKQFNNYRDYLDIYFPYMFNIKFPELRYYIVPERTSRFENKYIDQVYKEYDAYMSNCGCTYDTTVKRETRIR